MRIIILVEEWIEMRMKAISENKNLKQIWNEVKKMSKFSSYKINEVIDTIFLLCKESRS